MRPSGSRPSSRSGPRTRCCAPTRSMWWRGRPTRSTRCGARPGTRRGAGRRDRPCPRAQTRPVRALEEPRGPHLAPRTQAGVDRQRINPQLSRAYLLKEQLRAVFRYRHRSAIDMLHAWLAWASRSRIPAFVELARKIRRHLPGIEAALDHDVTNALIESTNTKTSSPHPCRLRVQEPRRPHRPRPPRPRRLLPRPTRPKMTHGYVRRASSPPCVSSIGRDSGTAAAIGLSASLIASLVAPCSLTSSGPNACVTRSLPILGVLRSTLTHSTACQNDASHWLANRAERYVGVRTAKRRAGIAGLHERAKHGQAAGATHRPHRCPGSTGTVMHRTS